jgi:hypothetical protein
VILQVRTIVPVQLETKIEYLYVFLKFILQKICKKTIFTNSFRCLFQTTFAVSIQAIPESQILLPVVLLLACCLALDKGMVKQGDLLCKLSYVSV